MSKRQTLRPRWLRTYESARSSARVILEAERTRVLAAAAWGQAGGKGDERTFERTPRQTSPQSCAYCEGLIPPDRNGIACSKHCARLISAWQVWANYFCPLCQTAAGHSPNCRMGLAARDGWTCGICLGPVDQAADGANTPVFYKVRPAAAGGDVDPDNLRLGHLECATRRNTLAPVPKLAISDMVAPSEYELEVPDRKLPTWLRKYLGFWARLKRFGISLDDSLPELDVLRAVQSRPGRMCLCCGAPLGPLTRPRQRYCSPDCADRFRLWASLAQRQCPTCGQPEGRHNHHCRLAMAERDGWICWLCGDEVSPYAIGALSATFDHVVPRRYRGPTQPANLRLAHRRCNSRRGAPCPEIEVIERCAPGLLAAYAR
jgi:5-methylcytosine-specific restriction endonuclease McrA